MNVPETIREKLQGTFESQLMALLDTQYGVVTGEKIKRMFVEEVNTLAHECLIDQDRLDTGQIVWSGVAVGEGKGYGKTAKTIIYVPIVLDLVTKEDLDMISAGFSLRERRKSRIIRLFEDAYQQKALLTHSDVAYLLNVSTGTVGKDVKEYIIESGQVVHTRGIVHDIGPSTTHKGMIVRLWYEGYMEPEICQKTHHSLDAVNRYIKGAQRVEIALDKTDDPNEIGAMTGMTPRLVKEYIEIIKEMNERRREQP